MSDADWEALPKELLCGNPGEFAELAKRPAPPPAATVAPAPSSSAQKTAPAPVVDLAAERALLALQQQIAARQPSTSWVAQSLRRAARQERKEKAANTPVLAETLVEADHPPAQVTIDEQASNLDARELEPWFKELPQGEQERLRLRWFEERNRFANSGQVWKNRLLRAFGNGALVMGALGVMQSLLLGGFDLVPKMVAAGATAATFAELCRGDRFVYALWGGLGWTVVMGPVILANPFAMPGLLMAAYGMGAIGMEGEMRRSGGFDAS